MSLLATIESTILSRGLLSPNERILVAVSGGLDSMVLLHLLHLLAPKFKWELHAAHFNHQLRGETAGRDEGFVRAAAAHLGLKFHAGTGATRAVARQERISIEMAARKLRHEFLARTARAAHCSAIALAHHRDDQVETFWLRLLRGEAGLSGMQWKRPSPVEPGISLVRPLLDIPKPDLLQFACEKRIEHCEDETNADLSFDRNQLRREILPFLEKLRPDLRNSTLRLAEVLSQEKLCIASLALDWFEIRSPAFDQLHTAIQREILRVQLLRASVVPTFQLIERLRANAATPIELRPRLFAVRSSSGELDVIGGASLEFDPEEMAVSLQQNGEVVFSDLVLHWKRSSRAERRTAPQREYFDARKVGGEIVLRHWRPGDRYRPIGNARPSKLQDIFVDLKIPASERRKRAVAVANTGEIFWVEGLRIAEDCKVTAETSEMLEWSWSRASDEAREGLE